MRTEPQKPKRHDRPRRARKAPPDFGAINFRAARAAMLDRLADAELQHGHHLAAERLAHQATELREAGQ